MVLRLLYQDCIIIVEIIVQTKSGSCTLGTCTGDMVRVIESLEETGPCICGKADLLCWDSSRSVGLIRCPTFPQGTE